MPETASASRRLNPRIAALCVLAVGFGAVFHVACAFLITHGVYGYWWVAGVAVILFGMLYGLCAFAGVVVPGKAPFYVMAVAIAASIFVAGLTWPMLCGFVFECLGFGVFMFAIKHEAANRIKLSLAHVMAYRSTFGIVLGVAAVSCMFYGAVNANVSSGKFQDSIASAGVVVFNEAAKVSFEAYEPSMTVDELIRQQIPTPSDLVSDIDLASVPASTERDLERRLEDAGIDPALIDLNAVLSNRTQQEQALTAQVDRKFKDLSQDIVDASRQQLSDSIGVLLDGSARVEDAVRDVLRQRIGRFSVPQLRFVPLVLAATFFLTLMLFSWLYTMLAVLFARLFLSVGVHTDLVARVEEQVSAMRYRFQ